MKAGELKRLVADFLPLLPPDWRRVKNELMRRSGDWVQILSFNASSFGDRYVPRTSFQFLKIPGVATGGFLVQELKHDRQPVQRWVSLKEHKGSFENVFAAMATQFRPPLLQPLVLDEIRALLEAESSYWPHAYALCVMAAEGGHRIEAEGFLARVASACAATSNEYVKQRKRELEVCLDLMRTPEELKEHLAAIAAKQLQGLGLDVGTESPSLGQSGELELDRGSKVVKRSRRKS